MKRSLAAFLISLLLVPSLACATNACPIALNGKASAKEASMPELNNVPGSMNCHQMKTADTSTTVPMSLQDCLGLDLFHQLSALSTFDVEDHQGLDLAKLPLDTSIYVAISVFKSDLRHAPPSTPLTTTTSHPLYFSTQRIRI